MPLPASGERPKAGRSTGQIEAKPGAVRGATLSIQKLLDAFLDGVIERNDYAAEKAKLMSRKKSLEEQIAALSTNRANWLEPFQEWILTAKNADEIAVSGFPQEKKVLARQVFGSNLVLDCKKARGSCVKPCHYSSKKSSSGGVVPATGLEPVRCYPLEPESSASANSATRAQWTGDYLNTHPCGCGQVKSWTWKENKNGQLVEKG